ncbi:MAG: hypothetical protein IKX24_05485 [Prevotella sp.]|nr:hypothetical protein [Prevotella sp.]
MENRMGIIPLSEEIVKGYGYDCEVPFDCYVESYKFGNAPMPFGKQHP